MTAKSLSFSILFFVLCFGDTHAQSWQWGKTSGNTADDAPHSAVCDTFGNLITVGYFTNNSISFGSTTLTNSGSSDIFVVKHSTAGDVQWAFRAGGTGLDRAFAVTTDATGNSYVAGYFGSSTIVFGTTTLTNSGSGSGNLDIFVIKVNAAGTVLWAKNSGIGTNSVEARAIALDNAANVYVTGYFGSTSLIFGTTTLTNSGTFPTNDAFVAKYSNEGVFQWVRKIGGTSFEEGYGVCTDGAGNVYVSGDFRSPTLSIGTTTLSISSANYFDGFLAKFDSAGNPLWAKQFGGSSNDQTLCMSNDPYGHIYIGGIFQSPTISFGNSTLSNAGNNDVYFAKYDTAGNELWAISTGGTGNESIACIKTNSIGDAFLTGYFFSPSISIGSSTLTNSSSANVYIAHLDSAGNDIQVLKNDSGKGGGIAIAPDKWDNIYVAGTYSGTNIKFDTITLSNTVSGSTSEIFIAKYGMPATYSQPTIKKFTKFSISPNPGNGSLLVTFEEGIYDIIMVHDVVGREFYTENITKNKGEKILDLTHLPNGVYIISLWGNEQKDHQSFVKQ